VKGVRESASSLHEVWTRHIVGPKGPARSLDDLCWVSASPLDSRRPPRREHNEILGVITPREVGFDQVLLDDDHDVWVDGLRADLTSMLCALAYAPPRAPI